MSGSRPYTFPVKKVGTEEWLDLTAYGVSHEFVGETVKCKNENYSFGGNHRVRQYYFKKSVHWKVVQGLEVDISAVAVSETAVAPRRQGGKKDRV